MTDPYEACAKALKTRYPALDPGRQTDVAVAIVALVEDDEEALTRLRQEAGVGMLRSFLNELRNICKD
jgi:hypothetical protein